MHFDAIYHASSGGKNERFYNNWKLFILQPPDAWAIDLQN